MGLIRKTLSVGTLGIVSFRSKKEKLRRAERSQHDAEVALEHEHAARLSAEVRTIAAEKRVRRAKADAEHASRKNGKRKRRRSHKPDGLAGLIAGAEPIVRSGMESARSASSDAAKRGRRVGRRARKAAKRSAIEAKRSAIEAKKAAKLSAIDARKAGRKVGRRARKAAQHTATDAKHVAERTLHQAAEAVSSSK